jgi:hypothetical protein
MNIHKGHEYENRNEYRIGHGHGRGQVQENMHTWTLTWMLTWKKWQALYYCLIKWMSRPPQPQAEKLVPYISLPAILVIGLRDTLCKDGSRRRSCDVWWWWCGIEIPGIFQDQKTEMIWLDNNEINETMSQIIKCRMWTVYNIKQAKTILQMKLGGNQGGNCNKAKRDYQDRVQQISWFLDSQAGVAGLREWWPKATQLGPSGSSPLRSDGSHDG